MTDISPLAVRLRRLHTQSTGPITLERLKAIVSSCSSDTLFKLRESSDEEIYAMFAGHYPHEEFYLKLTNTVESFRLTDVSRELRRVLELMDPSERFADERLILALDLVMPPTVRHVLSEMSSTLLDICVSGSSLGGGQMSGSINNVSVTVELPPTMDSYLEVVFSHVEACG